MERENETKRVFGDNPVTRMNTFEKLTSLKQPRRQPEISRILTTPEEIVRDHREMMRRMAPGEREDIVIYGRPSTPRLRWAGRPWPGFKRNFVRWGNLFIAVVCITAVVACLGYVALTSIIPFVRMLILG